MSREEEKLKLSKQFMFDRDLFNSLRRLLPRKEIRIGLRYTISVSVLLSSVVKTKTKQCNVSTTTE